MKAALGKVNHGDCIDGMAAMEAGSVDLVFADPPFNIGYAYDAYDDRQDYDKYLDWSRRWIKAVHRVLKPTGTFWLAIGDEYAAELKLIAQRDAGFHCRSWVVWYYTFGVNCKKKFSRSHTHLFHFVKDRKNLTFNAVAIRVPSARQLVYNDKRQNPDGRLPDDTWILRPQDVPQCFRPKEDTWHFSRVCGTFRERQGWHGCQMPEQLLGRIVRSCSYEGEVVLDPFVGSGTTLVVAKKLGRQPVGFELSPKYAKQAQSRLTAAIAGAKLEGLDDPHVNTGRSNARGQSDAASAHVVPVPAAQIETRGGQGIAAMEDKTAVVARAYLKAADGFSIDRVIADPDLNAEFVRECRMLGMEGKPADWNHLLLSYRKAGMLAGLPRPRKTIVTPEELDQFIFASEISWQLLVDAHGLSLDDILCDPDVALEFDETAKRFAPGWRPFQYRWGALTLRKRACKNRQLARGMRIPRWRTGSDAEPIPIDAARSLPPEPGVYLLEVEDNNIYLGETLKLRDRVETQRLSLDALLDAIKMASVGRSRVGVRFVPRREARLVVQAGLLGRLRTRPLVNANYDNLACAR